MSFNNIKFTTKGRNLHAKAQVGAALNFTRIAIGDSDNGGASSDAYDALLNQIHSMNITKLKPTSNGTAIVGGVFNNSGLPAFYFREIGLFAMDPDLGEILYCYGNAGANAEHIPEGGGSTILERELNIIATVGNATSLTANIDYSMYATMEFAQNEVATHNTHNESHVDIRDKINYKADLVNGKVPSNQLPEMDYLSPMDDTKTNIVTFVEATSDVDIASGDTHSTLFGKILKNLDTLRESIYNIVNGGTTVGKAVTLNGLLSSIAELNFVKGVTSAIQTQLNGKAPTSHSSTGTTYGVGTSANHGHVKVINNLTTAAYADGQALSPYQGKLLKDLVDSKNSIVIGTFAGDGTVNRIISLGFTPIFVILAGTYTNETSMVVTGIDYYGFKIVTNGFQLPSTSNQSGYNFRYMVGK